VIVMAALRPLFLAMVWLVFVGAALAQTNTYDQNPAELKSYTDAIGNRDAGRRAQALEIFIAWYPNSSLRVEAHEQLMAAWQTAGNPAKADVVATKLLQIDPDNVRALANRAYVGRTRAASGDAAALAAAVAAAERGFAAIGKWRKPLGMSDQDFGRQKMQVMAIFNGVQGFAALQAKDYGKARRYYLDAVAVDPDNFQDVYQLSVALLEGVPTDALGFWYAARAVVLARASKNGEAAASIEKYARSRYLRYHGSEEGWDPLVAKVAAGERLPPDNFSRSISRVMTPEERALQLVTDNDPGALSYADWEAVLAQRDASPANKSAAERVWRAIVEKQRGGEIRLKIPVKVVAVAPDRLQVAITDANQASNTADMEVKFAHLLQPVPAVGQTIAVVGTLTDYRVQPFSFVMTGAELAPESMPVAGGTCANPRPQMCTRDYRPACGLRRDNTSRTYGNACSACADPDVISQAAGACPTQ
jgi:tetratricopeptide (TPR) repeat protein